jgi:hypothetical protein
MVKENLIKINPDSIVEGSLGFSNESFGWVIATNHLMYMNYKNFTVNISNECCKELNGVYPTYLDLVIALRNYCEKNRAYNGDNDYIIINFDNATLIREYIYSGMDDDNELYEIIGSLTWIS